MVHEAKHETQLDNEPKEYVFTQPHAVLNQLLEQVQQL